MIYSGNLTYCNVSILEEITNMLGIGIGIQLIVFNFISKVALLFVILLTGAFSFIQEHRGAAIAKTYEKLCPHTA